MKKLGVLFLLVALGVVLIPQGAPAAAQAPVPFFNYTADNSTCNGDGTMAVASYAEWAQYDGTIQTLERNPAETQFGGPGEYIIRGPVGDSVSGPTGWNFFTWTLEADDTGYEIVRGRDGATLSDPLIYAVRVNYSCAGIGAGQPAVITYGPPVPESPVSEAEPGCDVLIPIPEQAVSGTFTDNALVYWMPGEATYPPLVIEVGKSYLVAGLDESGQYYKVLVSCEWVWVEVGTVGPNYDAVWNGAPLPTEVVE